MKTNRAGNKGLDERLKELAHKGSAVDLSVAEEIDQEAEGLKIMQGGGVFESKIFELPDGGTGYIIYLRVFNQTSRTIFCEDIELRVFGEDSMFNWMPDPRESRLPESYRFRGKSSPEFPREVVLNHILLEEDGGLAPRVPFEGCLLATGGPLPKSLGDKEILDAKLRIFFCDGAERTETIQLRVERGEAKPKFSPKREESTPTISRSSLKDLFTK